MKKLSALRTLAALTAVAMVGLVASPAMAGPGTRARPLAADWTVTPGGSISLSGPAQVKDTQTGTVAKCTTVKLGGTLQIGSGLSASGIGTITSASFSGCTIATISVTVAVAGLPWEMNAVSDNPASGVVTGSLEGVDLVATAPGCSATLDGTAAGADDGLIKITYSNDTGTMKLLSSGGNLHSWAVSGCFGLVNDGDTLQAAGGGPVQPGQVIDDPINVGTIKVKVGTKKPAQYANLPGEGTFTWKGTPPLGIWVRQPGQLPQNAQPPGVTAAPANPPKNDIIEITPPATGWPNNPGKYQVIGSYTDGNGKAHDVIATLEIVP